MRTLIYVAMVGTLIVAAVNIVQSNYDAAFWGGTAFIWQGAALSVAQIALSITAAFVFLGAFGCVLSVSWALSKGNALVFVGFAKVCVGMFGLGFGLLMFSFMGPLGMILQAFRK